MNHSSSYANGHWLILVLYLVIIAMLNYMYNLQASLEGSATAVHLKSSGPFRHKFIIISTADRPVPYILFIPFELRSRAFGYLATWRINAPLLQT